MKHRRIEILRTGMLVLSAVLFAALVWVLWRTIPWSAVRYGILGLCAAIFAVVGLWAWYQRRQVSLFADDLCETLDALLSGRQPENYQPYEDSLTAKVQGKLMQYFDIMSEGKRQSQQDKQVIQSLVSDISHQVKTPIANIKMFTNILQQHQLPPEKQAEFLCTMEGQIDKLDFLMQSLIKMSRLETGTFVLHPQEGRLADTIALAMSAVWAKAEAKEISLSADCDGSICVQHGGGAGQHFGQRDQIHPAGRQRHCLGAAMAVLHPRRHRRHRHRHCGGALQRYLSAVLPRPAGGLAGGRRAGAISSQRHHHPAEGVHQCKIEGRKRHHLLGLPVELSGMMPHPIRVQVLTETYPYPRSKRSPQTSAAKGKRPARER